MKLIIGLWFSVFTPLWSSLSFGRFFVGCGYLQVMFFYTVDTVYGTVVSTIDQIVHFFLHPLVGGHFTTTLTNTYMFFIFPFCLFRSFPFFLFHYIWLISFFSLSSLFIYSKWFMISSKSLISRLILLVVFIRFLSNIALDLPHFS